MTPQQFDAIVRAITFNQVTLLVLLILQLLQFLGVVVIVLWSLARLQAGLEKRNKEWVEIAQVVAHAIVELREAVDESRNVPTNFRRKSIG